MLNEIETEISEVVDYETAAEKALYEAAIERLRQEKERSEGHNLAIMDDDDRVNDEPDEPDADDLAFLRSGIIVNEPNFIIEAIDDNGKDFVDSRIGIERANTLFQSMIESDDYSVIRILDPNMKIIRTWSPT